MEESQSDWDIDDETPTYCLEGINYPIIDQSKIPNGRSEVDLKIMDLRINTVYETVMITGNMVTKVWGNERGGEVQNTPIWYIGLIKERGLEETKYQRLEDRM